MATAGPPEVTNDGDTSLSNKCAKPVTTVSWKLVDEESQIDTTMEEIRKSRDSSPLIAVDCEGEQLSRKGKLSVVSIATEDHVYIFDIKALGEGVFDNGLRGILEDTTREKLMFDCREDSDCLWHQFKVKLANVLDLQLLQVIYREKHPDSKRRQRPSDFKPEDLVRSFIFCLREYVEDKELAKAKEAGKEAMSTTNIWLKRPLSEVMLKYAACDVRGFFQLYRKLETGCDSQGMKRARVASATYLDFFRARSTRHYDEYEMNSLLPRYVVPPKGSLPFPYGNTKCVGCLRFFPRRDFSKTQLRSGTQKCPVCKEMKRKMDVDAQREKQREEYEMRKSYWDYDDDYVGDEYDGYDSDGIFIGFGGFYDDSDYANEYDGFDSDGIYTGYYGPSFW